MQSSTIHSPRRHTLRGLHYQEAPHAEIKLVRCTRGSIFLVMVDLRPDSPTRNEWLGVELSARSERLAYVPEGFAQGYQTLEDDTEVLYQMSHHYVPEAARGVRWDDPAFGIEWPPAEQRIISERDRSWPDHVAQVGGSSVEVGAVELHGLRKAFVERRARSPAHGFGRPRRIGDADPLELPIRERTEGGLCVAINEIAAGDRRGRAIVISSPDPMSSDVPSTPGATTAAVRKASTTSST